MATLYRERAQILIEQRRYDLAANELRAHLASEPEDAYAHALLARCLSYQNKHKDAISEATAAIMSNPLYGFGHMILAEAYDAQGDLNLAQRAASEGVKLEPENASFLIELGRLYICLRSPLMALQYFDAALQIDSESYLALNLRALALYGSGRTDEAAATASAALEKNPLSACTHSSQGLILLEQRRYKESLFHYKEALRLEPNRDSARSGIFKALKAQYAVYQLVLAWSLLFNKFKISSRCLIIVGLYLAFGLSLVFANFHGLLRYGAWAVICIYAAYVYLTWTAPVLFNAVLRFNPYGRMLLTRRQVIAANALAVYFLIGVAALVLGEICRSSPLLILSAGSLVLSVFISAIEQAQSKAFRLLVTIATVFFTLFLLVAVITTAFILT